MSSTLKILLVVALFYSLMNFDYVKNTCYKMHDIYLQQISNELIPARKVSRQLNESPSRVNRYRKRSKRNNAMSEESRQIAIEKDLQAYLGRRLETA